MTFKKKLSLSEGKNIPLPIINASKKNPDEEEDNEDSSAFRDGFNLFEEEEETSNLSYKFEYVENNEGSDQNTQRKPPIKKKDKDEKLEESFLLMGAEEKNIPNSTEIDEPAISEEGNTVLTIDMGGGDTTKIIKPKNLKSSFRKKGGKGRGM